MDAEENSADCETIVDAEENSADCETVVDAEENRAVRLLWLQRRTVLLCGCCECRGEECCRETVGDAEQNSAAVRLL